MASRAAGEGATGPGEGADAASPLGRRLAPLMRGSAAARAAEPETWEAGYLDLLDSEPESTGLAQELMRTRLVPMIYERWWRPALARAVKGLTGPGMDEELRIAKLMLGAAEGDVVLDLACGPGNFSRELARVVGPGGLVVGLDASRSMLARAVADTRRAELDNLALIRGDASALPFGDGRFDGVCCFAALHLFADPFAALDEMARVLVPGGRIALMTSVRRQLTVRPLKPVIEWTSGMRVFEQGELVDALAERGFDEIRQRLAGVVQFLGATKHP